MTTAPPIPTLETPRLLLRAWSEDDLDDLAEVTADPAVMRFLSGTLDRRAAWDRVAAALGHWALRGYGNPDWRRRSSDCSGARRRQCRDWSPRPLVGRADRACAAPR
jgi:hypothetical protein